MINEDKMKLILDGYKPYFHDEWVKNGEIFKWQMVKQFNQSWESDATNFYERFTNATKDTDILLVSGHAFPRLMIQRFAKADDAATKAMFDALFDESHDLEERINQFRETSEAIRAKYDDGTWKSHFQNTNAISTYLWLRYPNKYYVYKYEFVREIARYLEEPEIPKKDGSVQSMLAGFHLYDEICEYLKKDKKTISMVESALNETCDKDVAYHTLTFDICFYIKRFYLEAPNHAPAIPNEPKLQNEYKKEDFLREVYMEPARYDVLKELLLNKMNIILEGAPGVGKTFTAKRLAYSIMGQKDDSRVAFIQFHQNYSYEDFVQGYRPDGEGFKLTEGIFYRFCRKAAADPEQRYFFIIDEINRGNMSKIFGELLMAIEKDYRGEKVTLAYSGKDFTVPGNVYIIGMMNTADRSLAMIDYALRRRFSFFEIEPGFNSEGFTEYQKSFGSELFDSLINTVTELNREIANDASLGTGFMIGHSYFCGRRANECTAEWMQSVVEFDILPMLREYWFDNKEKLDRWEKIFNGIFDDN